MSLDFASKQLQAAQIQLQKGNAHDAFETLKDTLVTLADHLQIPPDQLKIERPHIDLMNSSQPLTLLLPSGKAEGYINQHQVEFIREPVYEYSMESSKPMLHPSPSMTVKMSISAYVRSRYQSQSSSATNSVGSSYSIEVPRKG